MSLIDRLFGSPPPAAAAPRSRLHEEHSRTHAGSQNATRRELLRVVLRDTLIKHGIPTAWLGAEMLATSGGGQAPGLHVRLLLRHFEPRLLACAVAFQHSFVQRVSLFDPMAHTWLAGISWQFALPDESVCPPLPAPETWVPRPAAAPAARPAAAAASVVDGHGADDQLEELRRLLATGDAARERDAQGAESFRPTEPARL